MEREDEGKKFNFFILSDNSCKDWLKVKKEPSLVMFRNRIGLKPSVMKGQITYIDSIVSWMWIRITPPAFDLNVENSEYFVT